MLGPISENFAATCRFAIENGVVVVRAYDDKEALKVTFQLNVAKAAEFIEALQWGVASLSASATRQRCIENVIAAVAVLTPEPTRMSLRR